MDNYSKRILAFDIDTSENSTLVKNTFEKALLVTGNRLPSTIVIDGSSAFKKDFKPIKKYTKTKGVEWVVSSNPKRKSQLERLISTIQSVYLRPEIGFIGEGIKSKKYKGRVSEDVVLLLNNPKYLKDPIEIKAFLTETIAEYNKNEFKENHKSPIQKYRTKKRVNAIKLEHWEFPLLFWEKHKSTGDSGIFRCYSNSIERAYKTTDSEFLLKYGKEKIDLYIHPTSKFAYAFENNTSNYIGQIELHERIPRYRINQTKKHKLKMKNHFKNNEKMRAEILNKIDENDSRLKQILGDLPDQIINYKNHSKSQINEMEIRNALGLGPKAENVDPYNIIKTINKNKEVSPGTVSYSDHLKEAGSGKKIIK